MNSSLSERLTTNDAVEPERITVKRSLGVVSSINILISLIARLNLVSPFTSAIIDAEASSITTFSPLSDAKVIFGFAIMIVIMVMINTCKIKISELLSHSKGILCFLYFNDSFQINVEDKVLS